MKNLTLILVTILLFTLCSNSRNKAEKKEIDLQTCKPSA